MYPPNLLKKSNKFIINSTRYIVFIISTFYDVYDGENFSPACSEGRDTRQEPSGPYNFPQNLIVWRTTVARKKYRKKKPVLTTGNKFHSQILTIN